MAWHGMAWHGMAWHGPPWHGMVWHGMAEHRFPIQEAFSLTRMGKSPTVFDIQKLRWVNGRHLRALPESRLAELVAACFPCAKHPIIAREPPPWWTKCPGDLFVRMPWAGWLSTERIRSVLGC